MADAAPDNDTGTGTAHDNGPGTAHDDGPGTAHDNGPDTGTVHDNGPDERPRPLAIVDIDGVVADVRHRLHHVERRPKDWDGFFAAAERDPVHQEGVLFVGKLARDHEVVFLTGRPEHLRADTAGWLDRHGMGEHRLVMRPHGDRQPARRLKVQLLRDLARRRQVAVVVDDDLMVIEAMREAGFPVLHADWEARTDDDEQALRSAQEHDGRS